jgi:maltose O-acetyltransferase
LILNPVVIQEGAWLRARCIILPGVTIGAGAVVEAGAVVNKDVPANTRVGGVPAVKLQTLEVER